MYVYSHRLKFLFTSNLPCELELIVLQDGTVKLWNYRAGTEISNVDCMSYIDDVESVLPLRKCRSTGPVADTCCRGVDVKCLVYCEQLKVIAVALEGWISISIHVSNIYLNL